MKRIRQLLAAIGPGIFAIGYTIGTGSVTSMAKAGADYGLGADRTPPGSHRT